MTAKNREKVKMKYGGKCAYSGTDLEDDWQIDHLKPIVRNLDGTIRFKDNNNFDNMMPVQKIINHYKHSYTLENFRIWLLGDLHERLKKLPKNPRTAKSRKRKEYLLKVASYFNITEDNKFSGKFYFENYG